MTSSPPSSRLAPAVRPESPPQRVGNWTQGLRSLWHLSRHLTARADDNHAAPRKAPRRETARFQAATLPVHARVRFLAYHRIKPHVPPLVRAPVNSFEFHRCRRDQPADGRYSSFTAWTTRVSNPVRSPRFRASASVPARHAAFAIGVLRHIYAFHRYTTHSACLRRTQAPQFRRLRGVEPRCFTADLKGPPAHPLNPINPDNARILRITAAAGTELADACSRGTLIGPPNGPLCSRAKEVYEP